jgi:hypothetical protein
VAADRCDLLYLVNLWRTWLNLLKKLMDYDRWMKSKTIKTSQVKVYFWFN